MSGGPPLICFSLQKDLLCNHFTVRKCQNLIALRPCASEFNAFMPAGSTLCFHPLHRFHGPTDAMLRRFEADSSSEAEDRPGQLRRYDVTSSASSEDLTPLASGLQPGVHLRLESSSCGSLSCDESDSSTSHSERGRDPVVDLSLERLQSLALSGEHCQQKGKLTEYAEHGRSRQRMADALRHPVCDCRCRIPAQLLLKLCVSFWVLPKEKQDAVLWSIQHESGEQSKKKWYLGGLDYSAEL